MIDCTVCHKQQRIVELEQELDNHHKRIDVLGFCTSIIMIHYGECFAWEDVIISQIHTCVNEEEIRNIVDSL